MATNHNRTLYKDYISAVLGKEVAEEQVRILNTQCRKLELYAENLAGENEKQKAAIDEKEKQLASMEREIGRLQALLGIDGMPIYCGICKRCTTIRSILGPQRQSS